MVLGGIVIPILMAIILMLGIISLEIILGYVVIDQMDNIASIQTVLEWRGLTLGPNNKTYNDFITVAR